MVLNNTVVILESNIILEKISDAYNQVTMMNAKNIEMNLPQVLEQSISTKTKAYETKYKIYVFKEGNLVYFILSRKKGKQWYNISGTSLPTNGYFISLEICDLKKCKTIKGNTLVYDPKKYVFFGIKKDKGKVIIYVK